MERFPAPASLAGLLVESLQQPSTNLEQVVLRSDSGLDANAFCKALSALAAEHVSLRTSFEISETRSLSTELGDSVEGSGFDLCIHPELVLSPTQSDWSELSTEQREHALSLWLAEDRAQGALQPGSPSSRVHSFQEGAATKVLVWTFHHAVLDGRSLPGCLEQVFARIEGAESAAQETRSNSYDYRDYLRWGAALDHAASLSFFDDYLSGFEAPSALRLQRETTDQICNTRHDEVQAHVPEALVQLLSQRASAHGASLNNVLQAAWALIVARHTDSEDVVFAATRAARKGTVTGSEQMLGCFINSLPLRVKLREGQRVADLLSELRDQQLAMRAHEQTPLGLIQKRSATATGQSLCGTLFLFDHGHLSSHFDSRGGLRPGLSLDLVEESGFDLSLLCHLRPTKVSEELLLKLEFDVEKYAPATMQALLRRLSFVLEQIAEDPSLLVSELSVLLPEDRQLIKNHATNTESTTSPETSERLFPLRLAELAQTQPDAPAVEHGTQSRSYSQLLQAAQARATHLVAAGVKPGDIVAVCGSRRIALIEALLAVQLAGGTYLPLDPADPSGRFETLLRDAQASAVISERKSSEKFAAFDCPVLPLEGRWVEATGVSLPELRPEHGAYIIYTSGTTGRPKGVVVEHAQLSHHCAVASQLLALDTSSRCLQFASPTFDVSVEEIFATLAAGATLVLRTEDMIATTRAFIAGVNETGCTVLNLPTAFWRTAVEELEASGATWPRCLRTLIVGGERVPSATYFAFQRQVASSSDTPLRFINGYGPTETTITSTALSLDSGDRSPPPWIAEDTVPIGHPLRGAWHRVVDRANRDMPPGAPGELLIGGAGVARGYRERPELTKERFIDVQSPVSGQLERCYRSGDRVSLDRHGLLHFVGRRDAQVKVRGYRIELGEIETVLRQHSGVSDVVVEPDLKSPGQLVAFIETDAQGETTDALLRRHLEQRLPRYMVPAFLVLQPTFARNHAGKTDLPRLRQLREDTSAQATAQAEELHGVARDLGEVWSKLLGVQSVGLFDSFFELGGHSLLAVKMFAEVERQTGRHVNVRAFFGDPTVSQLVEQAESAAALEEDQELEFQVEESGSGIFDIESHEDIAAAVGLQPSGEGAPLFMVCGIDLYRDLAEELGTGHPTLGLFLPVETQVLNDLAAGRPPRAFPSVREMAAGYIRAIRSQQPFGPYRVGGISFGGVLAYEVAQQLRAVGEEVDLVVLLDTFLPSAWQFSAQNWISSTLTDSLQDPIAFARNKLPKLKSKLPKLTGKLKAKFSTQASAPAPEEAQDQLFSALRKGLDDGTEAEEVAAVRMRIYHDAAHEYEPTVKPYVGTVLLIRAEEQPYMPGYTVDPSYGWGRLVGDGLQIQDVPGAHITMLRHPHVRQLAALIAPHLKHAGDSFDGILERYGL